MSKASKFLEPLAVAVAGGSSIRDAAEAVHCSPQTAYNISATTEFKNRVNEIRTQSTIQAVGKLTLAANKAVDTLVSLLSESNEPSVRLNASKAILGSLGPISEFAELRARIDQLENMKLKVA